MKKVFVFSLVGLLTPFLVRAQVAPVAPPQALTARRIWEILTDIANFLIAVGIVGAVITIVTAGIIYFFHGFSANAVTKAKGVFKNALIGTLLILGVGVIINTVGVIITGEFFGTVGPPGPPGGGGAAGGGPPIAQTGTAGGPCRKDGTCGTGLECRKWASKQSICVRERERNRRGEGCYYDFDCANGLYCERNTCQSP